MDDGEAERLLRGDRTAEYVALTQLQADAFVTLDAVLAHDIRELASTAPYEALS